MYMYHCTQADVTENFCAIEMNVRNLEMELFFSLFFLSVAYKIGRFLPLNRFSCSFMLMSFSLLGIVFYVAAVFALWRVVVVYVWAMRHFISVVVQHFVVFNMFLLASAKHFKWIAGQILVVTTTITRKCLKIEMRNVTNATSMANDHLLGIKCC